MKHSLTYLCVILAFLSCKDDRVISPVVPEGNRVVLLEEFTGKGCTNCPRGSREIDNLLTIYDSNLAVVSIHAGFFADPDFFDLGKFDLRTPEGEAIFDLLGPNIGYPAGTVDRRKFNGFFQHGANAWAAFIAEELVREPEVEFSISRQYQPEERNLRVEISGRIKFDLSGELRLSVMLVENGIIDAQDVFEAGGIVEDYEHKHVLRDMATSFDGEVISTDPVTGEQFQRTYHLTLLPGWVPENSSVIIFTTLVASGTEEQPVLQAGQLDVL